MEKTIGMGWIPDRPDIRDLTPDSDEIKLLLANIKGVGTKMKALSLPISTDFRSFCSPIENQLSLGSCTANAGVGLLEYFEKRAFGNHLEGSRLFLYKTTRNLLGWVGDTGAYLRTTMGAMTLFGVPPERFCPYDLSRFDIEPSSYLYAYAQNYKATRYFRLDSFGMSPATKLQNIKTYIAAGFPAMFGFTVYASYSQARTNGGKFPFPVATGESVVGGHAVVAVGYDDTMQITNTTNGSTTTGAFLIRNSWGTDWGNSGYGWIPYEYVLKGQANDFWSLISAEYVSSGQFGL
jgi:C1A family cysteine protease